MILRVNHSPELCGQTTANTLCFVFALLALYQDEQEKLYQDIRSVVPKDREAVSDVQRALELKAESATGI